MINNLNEILSTKTLYEDYIKMKKINIENSKVIYENIIFLLSLNELKLDKRNFDEFLKNKNNYILNGNKYKGNIIDGKGEMDYFIGKYEGNFKNGIKEGYGRMIYKNGDLFDGNWKNDIKEGDGRLIYNNKDIYDGNWVKGKKEGFGIIYYKNKEKLNLIVF